MKPENKARAILWFDVLLAAVSLYVIISLGAYNIRHPELTPMQVWMDFYKAIAWK